MQRKMNGLEEKNVILLNLSANGGKNLVSYYRFAAKGGNWGFSAMNSMTPGTELIIRRLKEEGKEVDRIIAMHTDEAAASLEQYRYEIMNYLNTDGASDSSYTYNGSAKAEIEENARKNIPDFIRQLIKETVLGNEAQNTDEIIKAIKGRLSAVCPENEGADELQRHMEEKRNEIQQYIKTCNYEKLCAEGKLEDIQHVDVAQKPEIIAIRMSGGGGSNKEIDAGTIAEVIGELRMDGNYKVNVYIDTQGGGRAITNIINAIVTMTDYTTQSEQIEYKNRYVINYYITNTANEIYDATSQYYINDLVAGMKAFIDYGKAEQLIKYIDKISEQTGNECVNERQLAACIKGVADAIQICNSAQMDAALQKLAAEIAQGKTYETPYFNILVKEIENDYGVLLRDDRNVIDSIEWCARKGFTQQALTYIEDKIPKFFCRNIIRMTNNDADFVDNVKILDYETNYERVMYYKAAESYLKPIREKLKVELLCNIIESHEKDKKNPVLLKKYLEECDGGAMKSIGEADTLPKFKQKYMDNSVKLGLLGGWEGVYRKVLEAVVIYMLNNKFDKNSKKHKEKAYNQDMHDIIFDSFKDKAQAKSVYEYTDIPCTKSDYSEVLSQLKKKLDETGADDTDMPDEEFIDTYIKYRSYAAEAERCDEEKDKNFWRSYAQLCDIKDLLKPELVPEGFYRYDSVCYIKGDSFTITQNVNKKPCNNVVELERVSRADIREIQTFIKLHEALKNERNNANHASEKGNRLSLGCINRAISLFVDIARDITAKEPENRYAECMETGLDEFYDKQ